MTSSFTIKAVAQATGLTVEEFPRLQKAVMTLRDNLLLASPGASDARLADTLERVGLVKLLEESGLNSWLGEGGRQLSGGELRRLAIARALLHDAPRLGLCRRAAAGLTRTLLCLREVAHCALCDARQFRLIAQAAQILLNGPNKPAHFLANGAHRRTETARAFTSALAARLQFDNVAVPAAHLLAKGQAATAALAAAYDETLVLTGVELVSVARRKVDSVKATREVSPRKRYSVRPMVTSPIVTGARLMM